ncbi:MAG: transcriptional regulator [Lachnospiraceae bacterium]|nr:transcriptional regulator [Lachnospiraceae bacterium]
MSQGKKEKFNYQEARERSKKFIRYKDGTEIYSIGLSKFQEIAKEAGAVYKINQMVLVNTEILDRYLERFKISEYSEEYEDD